jgi:hypothetical protein
MSWETYDERRARERAEAQLLKDQKRLSQPLWLIWAVNRPGLFCVYAAKTQQGAELLGTVRLGYPGDVTSRQIATSVAELIDDGRPTGDYWRCDCGAHHVDAGPGMVCGQDLPHDRGECGNVYKPSAP